VADQSPPPLAGKRVVVTRAESQSAALTAALKAQGAEVVSLPLIQVLPPQDYAPLDSALRDLANFDWLIFTSQNAVTAVANRISVIPPAPLLAGSEARNLSSTANIASAGSVRIAAVGKATAEAAESAGFTVAHIGQGGTAATLVLELVSELHDKRVLVPRSDRAASELAPRLHSFVALQKSSALNPLADGVVVGAIGPVTSVALRNVGLRCDFQASEPGVEEIVATLAVHFEKLSIQSASGANS
jgi:uroporphyrinogen-III synthase